MDNVKTAYDKEHRMSEPMIQMHDEPVIVWGPQTTINHLTDAMEKVRAWHQAKADGASAEKLVALLAAPAPQHPVLSPSALETPSKPRTPTTIPAPPEEEALSTERAPRVTVKLPKRQLKLKL